MTPTQAAELIGCSPQRVRQLVRAGTVKARRVVIPGGYYYEISKASAERFRDTERTEKRGWPRGKKRK